MKMPLKSILNVKTTGAFLALALGLVLFFQNCGGSFSSISSMSSTGSATGASNASGGSNQSVQLQWTAPFSGTPDGYVVQQSTDGTNFSDVQTVSGTSTSAVISGLSSQTYYFRVRSYNSIGQSNPTVASTVTLP